MPTPATLDELMVMSDEVLIRRALDQMAGPERTKLESILQMRWSMRNQKSGEENANLTTELVKQTTTLAKETKELADQTRYMATATFVIAGLTLIGLIAELVKKFS
jgi:hypothetical protein